MPRKLRQDLDGPAHHVIIKGHNGESIVTTEDDRVSLAGAVSESFSRMAIVVWAWALLTNHAHFFVWGPIADVSVALSRALSPYAIGRNQSLARSGQVFNGRFWSRPVHDDAYAFNLLFYVNLNPLKAGIVPTIEELTDYRWCSLGAIVHGVQSIIPVASTAVAELLSADGGRPDAVLRAGLEDRVAQWERDREMGSLPAIIRVVAGKHGLPPDALTDGTRGRWFTSARREIVAEARARGHSDISIAKALGISRVAVWKLAA
jgi:REP element-mobilizing transposase RayT